MSSPTPTTITCKGCGSDSEFIAWNSLNVSLNPVEKQKLLSGELTLFSCRACGWSGQVIYPLLYHDMDQQYMVWLSPDEDLSEAHGAGFGFPMRDYRFRRVRDLNQLKEKIYLFDDGFDDREVEVLKLIIEMRAAQSDEPITGPLLFSERVSGEKGEKHLRFAHLAKEGMSALTVKASALANVAESLAGRPELDTDDSWPIVDRAFAVKVLKALGGESLPRE